MPPGSVHDVTKVTEPGAAGKMPAWAMAAGVAALFIGITGFAKATAHWNTPLPDAVYRQLVPHANDAQHPMPDR